MRDRGKCHHSAGRNHAADSSTRANSLGAKLGWFVGEKNRLRAYHSKRVLSSYRAFPANLGYLAAPWGHQFVRAGSTPLEILQTMVKAGSMTFPTSYSAYVPRRMLADSASRPKPL